MRLSSKLLGWLNSAFNKDPLAWLALRVQYDGAMQWQVADGLLTTTVQGGSGTALSIDLAGYTVHSLAGFLALQPGYTVAFEASAELSGASALRLVEGSGDPALSNGDHLLAYDSLLHAYVDTLAAELEQAQAAIVALPAELATTTAHGSWIDYLGSYYAVPRLTGEADGVYSSRIITEVLRPLGNNVAIEAAIADYTGQRVTISDVVTFSTPEPHFSGIAHFDGASHFLPGSQAIYGLFDCLVGYDILGGDVPVAYIARLRTIIDRIRDAGTQLRAIVLTGSALLDTAALPTEGADTLQISHRRRFDGLFNFDGSFFFAGAFLESGTMSGTASTTGLVDTSVEVDVLAGGAIVGVLVPDGAGGTVPLSVFWETLGS
jgi:hypothetical protein